MMTRPVGKSGSTKNIHSIMLPFYVYFFIVLVYVAVSPCRELGSSNCEELSSIFLFVVLPLAMLAWIAQIRLLFKRRTSSIIFSIPGIIFGVLYGFGWYSMGNNNSIVSLLGYLLFFTFIFAAISTVTGLFFDYIIKKLSK
ncbi:MAG: hypothetical protein K9L85_03490 [Candidatus Peribacteraceae bacterium]|nr:hypothetical protein [Candidatus Peribacteraceae bacterium]